MPGDFLGWICGLVIWVGGTAWVVTAARRAKAARSNEIPQVAVVMAGLVAAFGFIMVGASVGIVYDLLTTLSFR